MKKSNNYAKIVEYINTIKNKHGITCNLVDRYYEDAGRDTCINIGQDSYGPRAKYGDESYYIRENFKFIEIYDVI